MWVLAKSLYNYRVWVYNFKILVNLWFLVFFPLTLLLLRTWAIWPIFHYNRIHSDLSWCDGPFSWPSKGNWCSAVKYVPTSSRGGRDGWWIVIIISRRPNKGPPIRAPLQEHYIDRRLFAVCVKRPGGGGGSNTLNSISQTPSLIFFGHCQWLPQSNLKHNLIIDPHKFIMGQNLCDE